MERWIIDNQYIKVVGSFFDSNNIKRGSPQMNALKEQLIQFIFKNDSIKIENELNGKPILKGTNWHVSVSHSNNWLFIQTTPLFQPGIDIEPLREKIVRIAPRFLNDTDFINLQDWPQLLGLHLIWGAKEAIYKSYSQKGLDFRKEIFINLPPYSLSSKELKGSFLKNGKKQSFELIFELLPNNELLLYITNTGNPI